VEIYNEGDGNLLIRTAYNRDRQLRITRAQLHELALLYCGASSMFVAGQVGESSSPSLPC
jgi:hypothetical protein